jgi:hypothetical protein
MAFPPPPYSDVAGITRAIMKDNKTVSITSYNGEARAGELVVDQLTQNLYVGTPEGTLILVGPSLTQTAVDDDSITLSLSNQNQHIILTNSSTVYVPLPSAVSLPIGYAVTVVVGDGGSGYIRTNGEGDQKIYTSGSGGNYVENDYDNIEIPQYTMATLLKIGASTWMVAGSGLTENYC